MLAAGTFLSDGDGHRKLIRESEGLAEALAQPGRERLRAVHAYWRQRCRDGQPPRRDDIDPVDIPWLLPSLFMTDILPESPPDYRFRLVGTRVAEVEGEMTGKRLSEVIPDRAAYGLLWRHYAMASKGEVALRVETMDWQDRSHINYAVLLLPLRRRGEAIDTLLGAAVYSAAV